MGTDPGPTRPITPETTDRRSLYKGLDPGEAMNAQLIDYTSAALHHRWKVHRATGNYREADTLSLLINYYIEGVLAVDWQEGEPCFSLSEYGKTLCETMCPTDGAEYSSEGVQLGLFSGASEEGY